MQEAHRTRNPNTGANIVLVAPSRTRSWLYALEHLEENGLEEMNPSMIYRTLREMEEKNWISFKWDAEQAQGSPRRVCHLTALGDEVLNWSTRATCLHR